MQNLLRDAFEKLQGFLLEKLAYNAAIITLSKKRRLAFCLAVLAFDILKIRRRHTISSLSRHLGLSRKEARKLGFKVYKSFFLNVFEMASLKYISDEEVLKKVSVTGLENLNEALSRNKGAILVSGHFGLWEFIPQWLSLKGYLVCTVVRRQKNKYADKFMEEMRHAHGAKTTDSGFGLRKILRALKNGEILALMVDQDNGKNGIFVPFFKLWASAPIGPAAISQKTLAPIVPLYAFENYKSGHVIKISKPIYPENFENTPSGRQQLTIAFTKELEENIKKQPESWFWLHRRWKTQPQDAPNNIWAQALNSGLSLA